jgi:hypothetical protein
MLKSVYLYKLRIKLDGEYVLIPQITNIDIQTSGTIQSWKPFEMNGFEDHLKTGASIKFVVTGQRDYGNEASDAVANCKMKTLGASEFDFECEFPDGEVIEFSAVVNTTKDGGGAAEDINALEFELFVKGQPTTKTEATAQTTYDEE